ncbi:MAG: hypothetical protein P4L82_15575 [Ancalomicrobiaceae bacterium]|nr:hypothetical protein [Ancalomicrobiaceae bacterium]
MSDFFAVGDAVVYRDGTAGISRTCRIIRVMPADQTGRHYHIRDLSERFERSVLGDTLSHVAPNAAEGMFKSAESRS